jgi:hypothetical protein
MSAGCTNPAAVNYNPAATSDNGSCITLVKYNGVCYAFEEVDNTEIVDESFTLSYDFENKDWVIFHDYIPDMYFMTRNQLFSLKNGKIYIHNKGLPGVYYNNTPKPFFVDAVFRDQSAMTLESVQWLTEVFNNDQENEFSTLTHITIWNNQQCTGRIALNDIFSQLEYNVRKTQALWSFNDFRDALKQYGTKFLRNIFDNFAVDESAIDMNKPWFHRDLLQDNWFCIRFEFDNLSGKQLILHSADITASKAYR